MARHDGLERRISNTDFTQNAVILIEYLIEPPTHRAGPRHLQPCPSPRLVKIASVQP